MLNLNEKILAIDIGKGTEDIFYFEPHKRLENCIQLIRPSRAEQLRQNLESQLDTTNDILAEGITMGGEPWNKPLYRIATTPGRNVTMTPSAATSLRYNLDQVRKKGVKIQNNLPSDQSGRNYVIKTSDIDFNWYKQVFSGLDVDIFRECEVILIACQEHGYAKGGGSVREFRMKALYQEFLKRSPFVTNLMFEQNEIPDFAWRFKSNAKLAAEFFPQSKVFLMDSSPAVILGTVLDPMSPEGVKTIINVGNGHTLVMIIDSNWGILAIWEHHTGHLTTKKFDEYLEMLFNNQLSNQLVLENGGHGYYQRISLIPDQARDQIIALGPNRGLVSDSTFIESIFFAHPLGNMMLSGPAGLLKTYEQKVKLKGT
ncbi:MAG: DUF1786 family protein [Candidatus Hodarchaeales archaeon]|jgi:uncharacterized protein (DUF1786 family)